MDTHDELRTFFIALSDEARLRIAAALLDQPRSVRELAAELSMKDAAVAKHLSMLVECELATAISEDSVTRYVLAVERLRSRRKVLLARESQPPSIDATAISAAERVILGRFVDGERLKEIPVDRGKRTIVLNWLVEQFEHERRYPEKEVNEIIKRHHPDSAALRRYLIDHRLMQRENAVYWRIPE